MTTTACKLALQLPNPKLIGWFALGAGRWLATIGLFADPAPGLQLLGIESTLAAIFTALGLVPQVKPSFDWIRLAQRVPVRVKLTKVPDGVPLIAGTTVSVSIED